MPNDRVVLSHSSLSILDECPRCFWIQVKKGLRWPEGYASRLPNRLDEIIKKYFDRYRSSGTLPPILNGKLKGRLEDPFQEKYYIQHDERYAFYGKLDECLITEEGHYAPVDHKTSSSDPRGKDPHPAYQKQLDAYAWLLEGNGKKSAGVGYLIFFYPDHTEEIEKGLDFVIEVKPLLTNPGNARTRFLRGVEVLEGPLPASSTTCNFCSWHRQVGAFH